MRRAAEILTTLVLFAGVMSAIGWASGTSAPAIQGWMVEHLGSVGFWAFFVLLWITGGVLLYREKGGRAGKVVGK